MNRTETIDIVTGQTQLYVVLKTYIKEQISKGKLKPGDSIPTEKWFSETFEVSRVTVRKAINGLIEEGVLERVRGKSPRIPYTRMDRDFNRLSGLSEQILQSKSTPSSIILEFKYVSVYETIAAEMHIPPGEDVLFIHRVRLADGIPIAIQKIYLNKKYANGLKEKELFNNSLYVVLENNGIKLDYCDQKTYVVMPDNKQRELLKIGKNTPLFYIRRNTYTKTGDVVEFVMAYYNSERYNLVNRLYR